MSITSWVILVLSCLLILAGAVAYGYRAEAKAAEATVAPLRQAARDANKIAEAHLAARRQCASEMSRVREANEAALKRAQADAEAAEKAADDYLRRLESPAGNDCDAFLTARVCQKLMDY